MIVRCCVAQALRPTHIAARYPYRLARCEYSERDLVLPTLQLLDQRPGGLTTTDLIVLLEARMSPDGHELEVIANRQDTYFSQKVRDLVSHRTLQKHGLVDHTPREHLHRLTEAGRRYLAESQGVDDSGPPGEPGRQRTRFGSYRAADEQPKRQQREPFDVDPNEVDRASGAHARIQDALAAWLEARGLEPLRSEGGEA